MSASSLGSRAIIGKFYAKLEQAVGRDWIDAVSKLFTSDQASEEYRWLGQSPAMREWIGGRNAKGFRDSGITILNKKFEATINLELDWIQRCKSDQIDVRIDELVGRTLSHWNKLLSALILTGETVACYDGDYFYGAAHSEGDSGTQVNLLTVTQVPALNIATPATPTEAEAVDALLGVAMYMQGYLDDQGEPMNENARKFLIMTKPSLASYLLKGTTGTTDETAVVKKLEDQGYSIQVIGNARLNSYGNEFDMFRTDASMTPFIRQEEQGVTISSKAEGSEFEHDFDAHQYGVKAKRNVGFGRWQYATHSTFS